MNIEGIGNTGNAVNQQPAPAQPQRVSIEERVEALSNQMPHSKELSDQKGKEENREKQLSENTVRETVSNVNNKMTSTRCEFSYHKGTNRVSIKVIDKDSDELIREIPPEKSLEMLQKMWELAGLFVDKRK